MTTFSEALILGREAQLHKRELKALSKTAAPLVTMKVNGTKELGLFMGRGWELVCAVPLGRGAGITQYIIKKAREDI